jgi:hypothetical protein
VLKLALGQSIGNRPLLLLAVLLVILGVQMVSMGLLAEMVMRTYHEVQNKPIYVIREILGSPEEEAQKMKSANPTAEGRTP